MINYDKWQKMELFELWEGIYLLLNKEPNWPELRKKRESYGDYGNSNFWNKFKEIKDIAKASIECYTLEAHTYDPDILYCKLIPRTFFCWAQNKGFKVPEPLIGILEEKTLRLPQAVISNKYSESGKLSGKTRIKKAEDNWKLIKPELLKIAKDYIQLSAHDIARKAIRRNIITDRQLSNTSKKILKDIDFSPFIKKKK